MPANRPDDVDENHDGNVKGVVFLASGESAYGTGTALFVDGGFAQV